MFSDKFYIAGLGEERGESSTAKVPIQWYICSYQQLFRPKCQRWTSTSNAKDRSFTHIIFICELILNWKISATRWTSWFVGLRLAKLSQVSITKTAKDVHKTHRHAWWLPC
jgi:hypothetical protein